MTYLGRPFQKRKCSNYLKLYARKYRFGITKNCSRTHQLMTFPDAIRWATMLKTAIDDMKMARL
jgi:hypothetical protein